MSLVNVAKKKQQNFIRKTEMKPINSQFIHLFQHFLCLYFVFLKIKSKAYLSFNHFNIVWHILMIINMNIESKHEHIHAIENPVLRNSLLKYYEISLS